MSARKAQSLSHTSAMESSRPVRAVVFDLDGTLYTLPGLRMRLTWALLRDVGVLRHLSGARAAVRSRTFRDREELRQALAGELSRRTKLTPEEAAKWYGERFMAKFVRALSKRGRVRPGLISLLESLKGRGVRLAVMSDYGSVEERLAALGIPVELFDEALGAEEFGVLKPSPEPLLGLARKWGIAIEAIIMVGDREDLDAACARAAGADFLGVADGSTDRADFVSWSEAVEALEARASFEP